MSFQFSYSVISNSLWPHGLQHGRPPCPSPTLGVYSDSCPSSWWCHPTHLILCHPLFLPPSVFPSIRFFSNESVLCIRCQSIGVSASASVFPMNIQNWFPLGLTTLCANSLQPHGQQPAKLFGPWNSPDKTTGMGSHSLLQGIFLTQGWDQTLVSHIVSRFFTLWATVHAC